MAEALKFQHYEVATRDDGSPMELGRGAMGITYKAFDTNLRCFVALKVINAAYLNSEVARQRFLREARAAAALRHPNVATVFHLGHEADSYFYAMEFIDGETLETFIRRRGTLDAPLALRIVLQVARALSAAQKQTLVHRDIKPANLMLVHDQDDDLLVKVIDFGLAKAAKQDGVDTATLTMGGFVGTPHFASPEQLEEREIDVRSDIYSLGVTLWYMLTGKPPFSGSLAQIMSQHLSKEPPFDSLTHVPEQVKALLRRLMAKEPEDRPQTPIELRREVEQCLAQLGYAGGFSSLPTSGPASAPLSASPEEMATLAEQAAAPTVAEQVTQAPATGVIIAGRYQMLDEVYEDEAGKVFRAFDQELNRRVAIRVLSPTVLTSAEAVSALERVIEMTRELRDPNLIQLIRLERTHQYRMLIFEWVEGFTLLEFLRRRGVLSVREVLQLAEPLARIIDLAASKGLPVQMSLPGVQVGFEVDPPVERSALMTKRVEEWPKHVVKAPPFDLRGDASNAATWMGEQTMMPRQSGRSLVTSLAGVIYELLGGPSDAVAAGRFSPIASLPEAGNAILRRALSAQGSDGYASGVEFYESLRSVTAAEPMERVKPPEVKSDVPVLTNEAKSPPPVKIESAGKSQNNAWLVVVLVAGIGLAVVAALAVGAMKLIEQFTKPAPSPTPIVDVSPTPSATPTATPAATPTATPTATPAPTPTPTPAATPTPTPTPTPPPTPTPTPSRERLLEEALGRAEEIDANSDLKGAVAAYLQVAHDFPESDVPYAKIDKMFETLRAVLPPEKEPPAKFYELRPVAEQAANKGVLSAMMYLGDRLLRLAPADAVRWFRLAAAKGDADAMTKLGLMYSNGRGFEEPSLTDAVYWFQQAAERNDPEGRFLLAECYLRGKGTEKDEAKAISLLMQSVDAGDDRAMNLLATCYDQGTGVRKEPRRAFELYQKAAQAGNVQASVNLGVLYATGRGVTADVGQAARLFKQGADAGNSLGMLYYGQMLIEGQGIPKNLPAAMTYVKKAADAGLPPAMFVFAQMLEQGIGTAKDPAAAKNWYRSAAEAGEPRAIKWCKDNGVPLTGSR